MKSGKAVYCPSGCLASNWELAGLRCVAIHRLELEGWVNSLPRKGIIVASIKEQDVKEVMQIRKANELLVIELITPRISAEQLQDIRRQFIPSAVLDENKLRRYAGGDQVHIQLAEACGNQRLLQLLRNLSSQLMWFGYWALRISGRIQEVVHEHTLILDAIAQRDLAKAKQYAAEHLDKTEAVLLQGLKLRDDCPQAKGSQVY